MRTFLKSQLEVRKSTAAKHSVKDTAAGRHRPAFKQVSRDALGFAHLGPGISSFTCRGMAGFALLWPSRIFCWAFSLLLLFVQGPNLFRFNKLLQNHFLFHKRMYHDDRFHQLSSSGIFLCIFVLLLYICLGAVITMSSGLHVSPERSPLRPRCGAEAPLLLELLDLRRLRPKCQPVQETYRLGCFPDRLGNVG